MAVDDAGIGRVQRQRTGKVRLKPLGLRRIQEFEAFNTIRIAPVADGSDGRRLSVVARDDELAAAAVRYPMRLAESEQRPRPLDAMPGPERTHRIIHPRVDHLG